MNWLRRNWPKLLLRSFGSLHLAFGIFGFYFLLWAVVGYAVNWHEPSDPTIPHTKEAFLVRTAVNLGFLVILMWAGLMLLRLRPQAVRVSNWLFVAMIGYFSLGSFLFILEFSRFGHIGPVGSSIGATAGIGEMGTAPVFITGYPLFALLGLNLARKFLVKQQILA
jgi:hypothetical protein